jgi:hypothetical protein
VEEKRPTHLYQYTSIDALAMIMKNKTLRLNCLLNVDDTEEGRSKENGKIGRYAFVSSWTSLEEESIPMWRMYTGDMKGVRIRLPINPFKTYNISSIKDGIITNLKQSIHQPEMVIKHIFSPYELEQNLLLRKVRYTNDEEKLNPKIFEGMNEAFFDRIGKYKRLEWRFQREWRYFVLIYPLTVEEFKQHYKDETFNRLFYARVCMGYEIPFEYYDLNLDENIIEDMEIVLGPKATPGDRIIVEALIDKYNSKAQLRDSYFNGKIRK